MVTIGGYNFEGAYPLFGTNFNNVPGIYVISTEDLWLDVGETDKLGERIANHDRKSDWIKNANGKKIFLSFLSVSSEEERIKIESLLRSKLNPVCGEK